jgi:8-oxo-dGTP diphosphatase
MSRFLTVDAVIIKNGKIVLIKRKKGPFKGYYALPGGYVERGEDIKTALVKEAKEETGLLVKPVMMVGIYDDPDRDERGNVTVAHLCRMVKGKLAAGSDSEDVGFFDIDKLPSRLAFDHRKIIEDGARLNEKKGVKVLVGGTFNIVHPGHVYFLLKARELGDELVVVVANDKTVLKNKKQLLFPAKVRAGMVKSLDFVDRVVIGDELDMMKVVRLERPDIIAMGYDQDDAAIKRQVQLAGFKCRVVKLGKLKGYSTKKITGG